MQQITIIWAWAAWLMAAATILENIEWSDYHVQIFEKNTSPGKKVIISGGGRCNVTTGIEDKKILLTKYTRGADFIRKAFGKFSPRKCREWFESHNVPLKCEADNRVFPVSDDGTEIVEVFTRIFARFRDKVTLHYTEGVDSVTKWDVGYEIVTARWSYTSDIVIVTTGWNAYSHTGSTGDGYAFARSLGHSVTQLGPSLSSFLTREKWTQELSGLAFESARIWDISGPLLLTHFGISGPLAFMTSSQFAWDTIDKQHPKTIQFSPIATMWVVEWESFLKEQFANHPKKLITSILTEHLPRRFAEGFVHEYFAHIETTFPVSIAKIEREKISKLLWNGIPLTLIERRPWDEFVTAGGVNTDEIDPETMESKIQENLYFAGEVLNVDGYTWGFSLQICWASGYVAGRDIVDKIKSA
jgi:predicted Rossmann fold flavoprotein